MTEMRVLRGLFGFFAETVYPRLTGLLANEAMLKLCNGVLRRVPAELESRFRGRQVNQNASPAQPALGDGGQDGGQQERQRLRRAADDPR